VLSVVTLVRNRNRLLRSFLAGIHHQGVPTEVVVVRAGGEEDPRDVVRGLPGLRATVTEVEAPDEQIPYSAARNAGAAAATGEHLAFCDADTIASPSFARAIGAALDEHDALCTGEVRYLPPGETAGVDFEVLREQARPHPHREPVPATGVVLGGRHELVWGLCMAMRHSTFDRAGGFDEGYGGYAGEDTDLGRRLAELGVPVGLVADAVVLHQHHDSFEPPVQQLRATVANAQRYRDRWGTWPMEGWLAGFARMGLVDWSPTASRCRVRRDATAEEVEACRRRVALPFEADRLTGDDDRRRARRGRPTAR
jgi:GT2 family glycosyltransferase